MSLNSLNHLPDINFVDADASTLEAEIIHEYETITGRTLAKGDPVRLFLLTITNIIILLVDKLNRTGKQNLLRYSEKDNLDHLGALLGVERLPASAAVTTVRFTLSATMGTNVVVDAGTRVTADGTVFFALDNAVVIPAGSLYADGVCTCTEVGTAGNGYIAGQIKTLVDPVPYVASVANTTTSEGGAEIEDDDSYREAIHIAPESFSVAGPVGAYEYHAKHASALISDVAVSSPDPGEVDVRVLLHGGQIPGAEMLQIVSDALNDRSVRPLTDLVTVQAPTVENYDINLTYYIDTEDVAQEAIIRANVAAAVDEFVAWTKAKIGRDINPSELIRKIIVAGAKRVTVTSPEFTVLDKTQIAIADNVTVQYGGTEDA